MKSIFQMVAEAFNGTVPPFAFDDDELITL
jgi:hypothetical protein